MPKTTKTNFKELIKQLYNIPVPQNAWDKPNILLIGKFKLCVDNFGGGNIEHKISDDDITIFYSQPCAGDEEINEEYVKKNFKDGIDYIKENYY